MLKKLCLLTETLATPIGELMIVCDEEGRLTSEANPNGSARNIAGICNRGRNVLGMMPHPERCAETILGNADGLAIFQSIAASFARV